MPTLFLLKILEMSLTQKYSLAFKLVDNPARKTITSSFKSISRDNKPSYASRYVRDFNDLDYEVPTAFSPKKKHVQSHKKIIAKNKQQNPEIPKQAFKVSPPKTNAQPNPSGIQANSYKIKDLFRETGVTADSNLTNNYFATTSLVMPQSEDDSKKYGLSSFEFEKTIVGKIQKRYSHHLQFEKHPNRPENVNKVWYSKNEQFSPSDREGREKDLRHKIHHFRSDSPHKVFVPKETLDKVYNLEKPIKLVKQRSDINIRTFERMKNRPDLQIKLGTKLQYETEKSLVNNKKPLFQISKTARKLQISRQVVSPERGCYR